MVEDPGAPHESRSSSCRTTSRGGRRRIERGDCRGLRQRPHERHVSAGAGPRLATCRRVRSDASHRATQVGGGRRRHRGRRPVRGVGARSLRRRAGRRGTAVTEHHRGVGIGDARAGRRVPSTVPATTRPVVRAGPTTTTVPEWETTTVDVDPAAAALDIRLVAVGGGRIVEIDTGERRDALTDDGRHASRSLLSSTPARTGS